MRLLLTVLSLTFLHAHATIFVSTKTRKVYADSSSEVLIDRYRYCLDRGGFVDDRGHAFAGPDSFVRQLSDALSRIARGGPAGRDLVSYLSTAPDEVDITESRKDGADMEQGLAVFWDPSQEAGGPDDRGRMDRPSFIGLAHELAHISDFWRHSINLDTWRVLHTDSDGWIAVPYAELYATHIENLIRAENGLALRVSYAIDEASRDVSSLLLKPGTRESLYFDCNGHTRYRHLRKGERPETY